MSAFAVTIYHNPACGTSRTTLAMIEAAGYRPAIVDYLKVGWTRDLLEALLVTMNASPRDILRHKGTSAADLGLLDADVSDGAILDAMVAHPILVNRPIVTTPLGTRLCRPADLVLPLLKNAPEGLTRADGETVRR